MERISSQVSGVCLPILTRISQHCSGRDKTKIAILPLGLLLGYCVTKRCCSLYRRRQTDLKLRRRQQQAQENKRHFYSAYPHVTERQEEIVSLDLTELKERMQEGLMKVEEVVEAFLAKAVEVDKRTNAVTEFLEEALEEARSLDALPREERGPLHGIPVSLKEHICVSGRDFTVGLPSRIGLLAPKDAELVRMLKALGAIPFCRTNLSQTCISFDCSNPIFGCTTNLGDPKRGPGGSSGGEGALVAGGGSIMGIGSDLGGSVRMPANFSGITSLKPTSGRVPLSGQGGDGGQVGVVGLFNSLGFMARSARDIEGLARELLGEGSVLGVRRDPRFVPMAWSEGRRCMDRKLRIGWYDHDGVIQATPGFHRAVALTADLLRSRGHDLVPFCPPNLHAVNQLYLDLAAADGGKNAIEALKDGPVDHLSLSLLCMLRSIPSILREPLAKIVSLRSANLAQLIRAGRDAQETWQLYDLNALRLRLIEDVLEAWEEAGVDVVIGPGMAMPAQPLGYPAYELNALSYTCVYNLLNFPAGSVPVTTESAADQRSLESSYPGRETDLVYGWIKEGTRGAEGRSLNVQVVGRPWAEEMVLRVMVEIEDGVVGKR